MTYTIIMIKYTWLKQKYYTIQKLMVVRMCGTRGSGVLACAGDVLEMSVVIGVGGVCDMCLARAVWDVVGEWVTGLGLGFTNSGGTWRKWDMCLFWLR